MVYTYTWNANFEALPPDTGENISQGANRIRNLKNAIRERLAVDHYFEIAGTDADHGEHTKIRFHGNEATPANVANKATLYPQLSANKLELFYKNNANQVVQLTANGSIYPIIPANTKMLFYADTAPTGWTIDVTMDDKLVFITKGGANGGQVGGGAHSSGTWQQANCILNVNQIPSHSHAIYLNNAGYTGTDHCGYGVTGATAQINTGATGGSEGHNHGATWRPAAYCFIVCSKN